ncbi:MAG: ATP-binding protein [Silvibacterium sp.]|nr:ATP-binding protein [Silvibacterium sp.]
MSRAVLLTALLLRAGIGFALDPHQTLRHYGYQSWQTDSGLPQNTVHAVLQSSDGYIWLATEGGLVCLDSVKFAVFTHKDTPQLGSDVVYSLLEDRSGALWIGTSSGMTRYRNRRFDSVGLPGDSGAAIIWSLHEDRRGAIWAVTSEGLARFDGARFQSLQGIPPLNETSRMVDGSNGSLWLGTSQGLFEAPPGEPVRFHRVGQPAVIQAMALDKNGRLWAGLPTGLEVCALDKCAMLALHGVSSAHNDVAALAVDRSGRVWIGTAAGLAYSDGARIVEFTSQSGMPTGGVQLLLCDREGTLWAGTEDGIARVLDGNIETFTPKEGFSSNKVLAILEDREGNLWLGTESGGIDILRNRAITTYTAQDGISNDYIRSVYQDQKGTVWLGTSGGGLDHKNFVRGDQGGFTTLTTANGLSSNVVLAIASSAGGALWLGTPDGLDRLRNGAVRTFTSADGIADDFVRSLYFDRQGALWIGTRRGLSKLQDARFTTYTAVDGLGGDLVGSILQSRDGSLWICTLGGLTHFDKGRFTNFTEKDGLASHTVTALDEDTDGTLWIGTIGGGLNRWRNGAFKPVAVKELPGTIYSILEDEHGNLWMSSNGGIFRVNRNDLNRYLDAAGPAPAVASYGVADGMKINEASSGGHPAAWRLQDGELWFATLKGAATIDPKHLATNRVPPLIGIEQMQVDDIPQDVTEAITIKPGGRRFAIDYAALSFTAPQKVRFKYRLEGFDHAWVEAGPLRTAFYTNLPPGTYTFRVLACNNDGVWSTAPASVSFRLKPYFYQTRWFYLFLLAAAALLWYAGYRWRLRHVESRFNAVMAERNRIAREIHDTLAQGFVAVSVQLQIVSRLLGSSTELARQHLARAQELVRHGLEDARQAIWELRSQSAENQDLAAQLAKMADRVTAGTRIRTEVRVNGAYRPLGKRIEEELVRIAQEAVTNAVRHANPELIQIQLRFSARQLQLSVDDNGRGFAGEAASMENGHFGIAGMKERAQQIGGTLSLTSTRGQGTRVTVELGADGRE